MNDPPLCSGASNRPSSPETSGSVFSGRSAGARSGAGPATAGGRARPGRRLPLAICRKRSVLQPDARRAKVPSPGKAK